MKRLKPLPLLFLGFLLIQSLAALEHLHPQWENLDRRSSISKPSTDSTAARKSPAPSLSSLQVKSDPISGSPRWIASRNGFLTGRLPKSAAKRPESHAAKEFIRDHPQLFPHGVEALDSASVRQDYVSTHNGLRTTVWQQELDGIPVFEGLLVAHVTRDGELVNLSSRFLKSLPEAAHRSTPNRAAVLAQPPVSGKEAIALAAANLDISVSADAISEIAPAGNQPNRRRFQCEALDGIIYVEKTWLPIGPGEMRLCWQVILTRKEHRDMFLILVDALDGSVWIRRNLTRSISEATYRVFTGESPTPMSPGHPIAISGQPSEVERELVTLTALSTNASPAGWINDGDNETAGNNVIAHLDRNGDNQPDLPRPTGSPFRVFDAPLDLTQDPDTHGEASVIQLFYWCNWMHDRLYELGFTEEAGNFQVNNFGRGGLDDDPVIAEAQDSVGNAPNGATFSAPPDGIPGRLQMHLYSRPGSFPDRDSAFDAHLILHEYTHGLSERLVGGGTGITALQSKGLAEGWSDFYALALLTNPTNDVDANYPFAPYAAQKEFFAFFEANYYYGLRRYPYTTDLSKNPLTFKDIDPNQIGSYPSVLRSPGFAPSESADNVHNQGEIWCVTLWEARANLIAKYGPQTGNELILQLVTDGMKLCPPNPNFLEARDAILQADLVNNGGANHPELWLAFAKRGMGFSASSPSSTTTAGVVEAFDLPDDLQVTPASGMVSTGLKGGPFEPSSKTFTLSNSSPESITWSLSELPDWLTASSLGGALTPGNSLDVTISIDYNIAGSLPRGFYTNEIVFTNETSAVTQSRQFILRIGYPDAFTELFDSGDFDLGYQSFTFTPEDSINAYSVCRETVTEFYSDPAGGIVVPLEDDDYAAVTLPGDVALYGIKTNTIFIGSNGYITFLYGDANQSPNLNTHFLYPRISALFRDLAPVNGCVSWKAFPDRVAITYLGIAEYVNPAEPSTARTNNFQIELFFDERIRITYLEIQSRNALVGLSRGTELPDGFMESDFSGYSQCGPALVVTVPEDAIETGNPAAATVSIPAPASGDLLVRLFSSDNTRASAPLDIIIPSGQTSAPFAITIFDNELRDGTQPVTFTATADGYLNGRATMNIHDDEHATLGLSLPGSAIEGSGIVQGYVFIQEGPADADVTVILNSSDPSILKVPESVVIPSGHNNGAFMAEVLDNEEIDEGATVTITATVTNWTPGTAEISILDDEDRDLRLVLPGTVREGNGTLPNAGSVHLSGRWMEELVIGLLSDHPDLTVPDYVVIPAGQTFVTFDITVGNNTLLDGPRSAQITAFSGAFNDDEKMVLIEDDEMPLPVGNPWPIHLSSDNPVIVRLQWDAPLGEGQELLVNGGFEMGNWTGWQTTGSNPFELVKGFTEIEPGIMISPFKGLFCAVAKQTEAGNQTLFTEVSIPNAQIISLQWADRVYSYNIQNTSHHFRVELRSTNDITLETLYTSADSLQTFSDWAERSFDLSGYRGQTIRIAFVIDAASPGLNIFLDDVRLRAANPPETIYDVYFATNAGPDLSSLVGSTTNTFWDLPTLEPFTSYSWKVVARRLGEAESPVWEFSTLPTLLVDDVSLPEGDCGLTPAVFNVQLSSPSPDFVSVNFQTISGTAIEEEDFMPANGTLVFYPGETNATIEVHIIGDVDLEEHETFFIEFTDPQFAALVHSRVTATILDDDSVLQPISDKTVDEGTLLSFITPVSAYSNALTFALSNAPAGAQIDPETGEFSWTPTESQGPGVYTMQIHVTDGFDLNESRSFTVTVNEVNTAPLVGAISNMAVAELSTLSFFVIAIDPDSPPNQLTYSLDTAPAGLSIHPATGLLTWTPTELQGPSTNAVIVRVTDNGSPNLSTTRSFLVMVNEVNSAPNISPIPLQYAYQHSTLTVPINATDNDWPANILSFSLVGTPPPGASIHPTTGVFTWENISAPAGSTNFITIRVYDNGIPILSNMETLMVVVVAPPVIQSVEIIGNELTLHWTAIAGHTYRVQYTTDLADSPWLDLGDVTAQGPNASLTEVLADDQQKFYRILLLQ